MNAGTSKWVLTAVVSLGLWASGARAQVIWNFTDLDANADSGTPVPNLTVGAFGIGNSFGTVATPVSTTSASSGYPGASGTGNIGNAVNIGGLDPSSSAFYSITLTPASGYQVQLSDLDFGTRSTATGPQAYSLRSSVDNFATEITGGTIANNSTWAFKDNTIATPLLGPADQPVQLRLYTFGGAGNPGSGTINSRLDDISISVGAVPVPEPASLAGLVLSGLLLVRRKRTCTR
jgi:hypothetical protein